LFEAEQLLRFLAGIQNPFIVVGDFNDEVAGSAYKLMVTRFADSWVGSKAKSEGFSYSADKPAKRIDYIFYRESDGVRARKAWVVRTPASDHFPVMVELELR
jgi:endonuclease/exonuclease/phosphatase family metal-dependent hydrolase